MENPASQDITDKTLASFQFMLEEKSVWYEQAVLVCTSVFSCWQSNYRINILVYVVVVRAVLK